MALQSMGRQGGNSMAVGGGGGGSSSIALHYEPPERLLVHPEMIFHKPTKKTTMTTRPCFQDPLSLGLDLYTKQAEPKKPEVDTSLHL